MKEWICSKYLLFVSVFDATKGAELSSLLLELAPKFRWLKGYYISLRMSFSHLGTGHEFLSLSVAQFKCMSVQWVQLLLTDTPCLAVSVLVVWRAISRFRHCTVRRRQSTIMIIRGLEDLIYKESLNEVESLTKCVRKDKNNWCCLVEAWCTLVFSSAYLPIPSIIFPIFLLLQPHPPLTHTVL